MLILISCGTREYGTNVIIFFCSISILRSPQSVHHSKKKKTYLLTETFPLKRVAGVPVAVQEVHTAEDLPHEILDLGGGQPWRWTLLQVTVEILQDTLAYNNKVQ